MSILVTGAAGFAGSHIVEEILTQTKNYVVALDCLTYAGRLDRLAHLPQDRIRVVHHDFREPLGKGLLYDLESVDAIVHNGAESHVLRSIVDPELFVQSNIMGTFNMLQAARELEVNRFLYVSTDEVYGPAVPSLAYEETDRLRPSNPYSATKAAGDMLALAWKRTFTVPVIITRTMNMFGKRQHPEKMVPKTIRAILRNEVVDIHCNAQGAPGVRHWLSARNQASAILYLLKHGVDGEIYNVTGDRLSNLEMASELAAAMHRASAFRFVDVFSSHPGHDFSYDICDAKIRNLGWQPVVGFMEALRDTVQFSVANPEWLEG